MFSKSGDRLTTFLADNALPLCVGITLVGVVAFARKYDVLYRFMHKVINALLVVGKLCF